MKEFGSDFHYIPYSEFLKETPSLNNSYQLYACGRHAIQHLISIEKWERIWLPEYFCYEIVDAIKSMGINVVFYSDAPGLVDDSIIENLPFKENDVLLRMNYFGLRSFRDNSALPIPVVEDHSHDLIGDWTSKSNADWCIASLRKTIPIAEGGVLWSPKQDSLPQSPMQSDDNKQLAKKRWQAMKLKSNYLQDYTGDKDVFRRMFVDTEYTFEKLPISDITDDCKEYLKKFDIKSWNKQKIKNWEILSTIDSDGIQILLPENKDCNMFSFIFVLNSETERELVRKDLIKNKLYPVVLWELPASQLNYAVEFSKRILSIPCDARYNTDDMLEIKTRLENALKLIN